LIWISDVGIWDSEATARILVVDDDEAMRRMVRLSLVSEGYEVSMAPDGAAGLALLQREAFDLVVLDLQMPLMDGRAMYAEMQRLGYQVPVFILSAYGAEAARAELNAAGALAKPFDTAVLSRRIRELLS
jgi:DNA-binding response OmpR family regulator